MNSFDQQIDLAREAAFFLGAVEIRPATRELIAGDAREVLEPRVMQVLVALARRRGEVVSRDELITACWAGRAVGDDAINRCIARLRRLYESHGGFCLETVPRVGYRLLGEDCGAPAAEKPAPADTPPPDRRRLIAFGLGALLLVMVGWAAAHWYFRTPAKVLVVQAPVQRLIAVLPFTPLSNDADTRLFGDAVATTVAETLSKTGQPVIPPSESFVFRGAAKAHAAQALHTMYVVDGEVRREAGRVRVSVRLDDSVHGTTVFARTFEEPEARSEALPERAAAYIAALSWGSDITRWDVRTAPAVLRACEQQERGDLFAAYVTARALAQAEPADAHVQKLYASNIVNLFYASPAKRKLSLITDARAAAWKALRLMPGSGEAYAPLASATPHVLWGEREDYLRKALSISPDSIGVAEHLTWLLNDAGRFRDSEPWARSAFERFPYHVMSYQRYTERLLGAGRASDALEILPLARRLWPEQRLFLDLSFEAMVLQPAQSRSEAFFADRDVQSQLPASTVALWRTIAQALHGRRAADIAAVARACAKPGDNWPSCMLALSLLRRVDDAYRIADAAYPDQRGATADAVMQRWLANDELPSTRYLFLPAAAAMRADPRFRGLVERVGLLSYWEAPGRAPDFCTSENVPVCRLLKSS